jgi:hypothetical protein
MAQVLGPIASPVSGLADQAGAAVSGLADQASGALGGLAERAGAPAALEGFGGLADQASGAFGGLTERAGDLVSGAPAATDSGSGDTATDEDLEKKIAPMFDKFADRLRNELRHQRERAGRLTDL